MAQLEQLGWKINHCPTTVQLMAHQSETQGICSVYKTYIPLECENAISSPGTSSPGEVAMPVPPACGESQIGTQCSTILSGSQKTRGPAPNGPQSPLPSSGTLSPADSHNQGWL